MEIKPPEESHEVARSESIAKPTVNPKYLTELENTPVYIEEETWGQSQLIWIGTETKFKRAERLTQLPEGVTLSDLSSYYPESWYKHVWFQVFEPGEKKEISALYLVPDEALATPDFAFFYSEWDKAFRIGTLL